jgi:two-component system response regulator
MKTEESKKVYFLLADNINEGYARLNEALQQGKQPVQLTLVHDYEQLIKFLEEGLLPDVILLDTKLPYKTFFENLATINEENFTNLPVIIFNENDYQPTLQACYDSGVNIFLMKPGSFKQLTSIVNKIHEKLSLKSNSITNKLVNEADGELAEAL